MHFLPVFIQLLAFLLATNAYVIPVRRIKTSHRQHQQVPGNSIKKEFVKDILTKSTRSRIPTPMFSRQDANPTPKYVVAHHMVGNTFPYTQQDWADDIALAHASGIDGFALNMGIDEWQPDRVSDAYEAALQSELDFKLFISLDMSSFPGATPDDAQVLRNIILNFTSHPNQLQINSQAFVSTFAGESSTFGQPSVPEGWNNEFVGHPDLQGKIHFNPSFFIDPTTFGDFRDVMDGDFNWNSGWPIDLTTEFVRNLLSSSSTNGNPLASLLPGLTQITSNDVSNIDLSSDIVNDALTQVIGSIQPDETHLQSLDLLSDNITARSVTDDIKPTYMAAVSPCFFTHYGADSYNKNFAYLYDHHLYIKRWESLITTRDQIDIVQILTWNDYGESHYIGPIKGAQPNSEAWVDGMNHTGE
ncbi:hypothetical protein H0H81_005689 [Sphagnurus paluster]|uniref:Glycoside hydrolase family 71 protein n=1 Tax=Sphagnurus paluster TaxID=117069 RepID=A0A9P7K7S7_9AGAR|nr:hypothetical protein H0H81_005689 [Sphagnurus paluster]